MPLASAKLDGCTGEELGAVRPVQKLLSNSREDLSDASSSQVRVAVMDYTGISEVKWIGLAYGMEREQGGGMAGAEGRLWLTPGLGFGGQAPGRVMD